MLKRRKKRGKGYRIDIVGLKTWVNTCITVSLAQRTNGTTCDCWVLRPRESREVIRVEHQRERARVVVVVKRGRL